MLDITFILFLFIFSVLCFIEFIVFNEEILLALCFFSFIFFSFNTLSNTVLESFEDRASKFESELLFSFGVNCENLSTNFTNIYAIKSFSSKFKMLIVSLTTSLAQSKNYLSFLIAESLVLNILTKLNELLILDTKLLDLFQKDCIATLLYPRIFGYSNINIKSFSTMIKSSEKSSNKSTTLKLLSI
jgi:hypothetical protein